ARRQHGGDHLARPAADDAVGIRMGHGRRHRHQDPLGRRAGSEPVSPSVVDGVQLYRDTYIDSVLLLAATRAMGSLEGITWATAVMATPANVEALGEAVVAHPELEDASASDLVLVARGRDDDAVARALAAASDPL